MQIQSLMPEHASAEVRAEQIRLLYHQGNTIQSLGLVTAGVAVAMFWKVVEHEALLGWFVIMALLTVIRIFSNIRFEGYPRSEAAIIQKWGSVYIAGTFLSGVVWGSLSFFFDPSWPAMYTIVLIVIYTGIIAAAFNTNSSYFIAFPAFFVPIVLSLATVLLGMRGEELYGLLMLFVIYTVQMYISSLKFHNRLVHSLEMRFENKQLADKLFSANKQLIELADKDELTKLHNRRSFVRYLRSEWNRHYINARPLSLLFIDVDYFKQYNDTYGHEKGDECLLGIAQVLVSNARRADDMAARHGGEEFAVLLPETDAEQAWHIAEHIHSELKKRCIVHENSSTADYVTVSIGVTTMVPSEPDRQEKLFSIADKALYKAKANGRNCTVRID